MIASQRVVGIDLAWAEGSASRIANETGVVCADADGRILDAGWTCGVEETLAWIQEVATNNTLAMIDAPLIVDNASGPRLCEREVGQRYGRWQVSANSTNLNSRRLAGVVLRQRLEAEGWRYDDGRAGPPTSGRVLSEVYPYTTIVGCGELGYGLERPRYKRKPPKMRVADFRPVRAAACDELLGRLATLADADPSLDLKSHPVTKTLVDEPSPLEDKPYKHREDLIDAALCAWTGLLWLAKGFERCQVLGVCALSGPVATIIAPARPEQRRDD